MNTYSDGLTIDHVYKNGDVVDVVRGDGYVKHIQGTISCQMFDTGNGFIAKFPSCRSTEQDYFVCMDYAQAREIVLALAEFKKQLGFD